MNQRREKPVRILMVEDNPDDVELALEALRDARIHSETHVARDGEEALQYLRGLNDCTGQQLPDLVLLDLNLPRVNGQEVLAQVKADAGLRHIPVIVLTTSAADADIARAYGLHANCYITKPVDFAQLVRVVRTIGDFWFDIVQLPSQGGHAGPVPCPDDEPPTSGAR